MEKVKERTWNVKDVSHICSNMQTTQESFVINVKDLVKICKLRKHHLQ